MHINFIQEEADRTTKEIQLSDEEVLNKNGTTLRKGHSKDVVTTLAPLQTPENENGWYFNFTISLYMHA